MMFFIDQLKVNFLKLDVCGYNGISVGFVQDSFRLKHLLCPSHPSLPSSPYPPSQLEEARFLL